MTGFHLKGNVALVTGAARGIGFEIALRLSQEGCRLVINDIDQPSLDSAERSLAGESKELLAVAGDVSDREQVQRLLERAAEHFGRVDVLVNNAALVRPRRWFQEVDESYFDDVIRNNVRSIYLCSQAAAGQMAQRNGGTIINLSSVAATKAFRANVPYVTSKGAVEAQTRALALDLAPYGIRVNAIAPGMIATEAWESVSQEELDRRRQVVPLGREGQPSDIAGAVAFLASPDAAYITGHVLYVDGGLAIQSYSPCAEIPHLIGPPPATFEIDLAEG